MKRFVNTCLVVAFALVTIFYGLYRFALEKEPSLAMIHAFEVLSDVTEYKQKVSLARKFTVDIPILSYEGNQLPKDQLVKDSFIYRVQPQTNSCFLENLESIECQYVSTNIFSQSMLANFTQILSDPNTYTIIPTKDGWLVEILDSELKQFLIDDIASVIKQQVQSLSGDDLLLNQLTIIKPPLTEVSVELFIQSTEYLVSSFTVTTGSGFVVEFNAEGPSVSQIRQFDTLTPSNGTMTISQYQQKTEFVFTFDDSYRPVDNPFKLLLGL